VHFFIKVLVLIASLALPLTIHGITLKTFPDAVKEVFPTADNMKRQTFYLSAAQLRRASEMAGEPVDAGLLVSYRITRNGVPLGWAYLDTHRVRTLNETILICIDGAERIMHVEVMNFNEPQEYIASDRFLELFRGKRLDAQLSLKGSVPTITGATLTCAAITSAARRVLALHRIVLEAEKGK
jgi:electron transport complex protein RnfG